MAAGVLGRALAPDFGRGSDLSVSSVNALGCQRQLSSEHRCSCKCIHSFVSVADFFMLFRCSGAMIGMHLRSSAEELYSDLWKINRHSFLYAPYFM